MVFSHENQHLGGFVIDIPPRIWDQNQHTMTSRYHTHTNTNYTRGFHKRLYELRVRRGVPSMVLDQKCLVDHLHFQCCQTPYVSMYQT